MRFLTVFLVALPVAGFSLSPMSEEQLSDIEGRDGISIGMQSPGVTADSLAYTVDQGTLNQSTVQLNDLAIQAVNNTGSMLGAVEGAGDFLATLDLDIGTNLSNGPTPVISAAFDVSRIRLAMESITVDTFDEMGAALNNTGKHFGSVALDAPFQASLLNSGLLNSSHANTNIRLAIGNPVFPGVSPTASNNSGTVFYRQLGPLSPTLMLQNFGFLWEMQSGVLGIEEQTLSFGNSNTYITPALVARGDSVLSVNFDLSYKDPGLAGENRPFTITGNEYPVVNVGASGGLSGSEFSIRPGGAWSSSLLTANNEIDQSQKTEGVNFGFKWNFTDAASSSSVNPEYKLTLGEASGDRIRVQFGDWKNLPGVVTGVDFPLLAIDALTSQSGPGGLCYGSALMLSAVACNNQPGNVQYVDFPVGQIDEFGSSANANGIGIFIREGNFLTYSTSVRAISDAGLDRSFDWGLVYTLANVNGNVVLYPGGNGTDLVGGSESVGILADVLLSTQTFNEAGAIGAWRQGENFSKGTHFLIADTDPTVNLGIGLLSASALLSANDLRIQLLGAPDVGRISESGLDLTSLDTRLNLRGLFGGGRLDGSETVRLANAELNLEGAINLRLSPPPNGFDYLAFSGAARLGSATTNSSGLGTFFSLAEPSRPAATLTAGNITGDLALVNGRLDLQSSTEPGNDRPLLKIATDIPVGRTAINRLRSVDSRFAGLASEPFKINDFSFSGRSLGSVVLNAGQWHSSITLKPQTP